MMMMKIFVILQISALKYELYFIMHENDDNDVRTGKVKLWKNTGKKK